MAWQTDDRLVLASLVLLERGRLRHSRAQAAGQVREGPVGRMVILGWLLVWTVKWEWINAYRNGVSELPRWIHQLHFPLFFSILQPGGKTCPPSNIQCGPGLFSISRSPSSPSDESLNLDLT